MEAMKGNNYSADRDIEELIEMLRNFKQNDTLEGFVHMMESVDSLGTMLTSIGARLDSLNNELDKVREQNDYLMSSADRIMKDALKERVDASKARLEDMKDRLGEIKEAIKEKAHEIVNEVKQFGRKALKKAADILHLRGGLEKLKEKADKMIGNLDGFEAKIEAYKEEHREKGMESRNEYETMDMTDKDIDVNIEVSMEPDKDHKKKHDSTFGTYQDEIRQFVDNCVAEGIEYGSNSEAYDAFKNYYDKKMKAQGQAGGIGTISRTAIDNRKR